MKNFFALLIVLSLSSASFASITEPNLRRELKSGGHVEIHFDALAWAFGVIGVAFEGIGVYFLCRHCAHKEFTAISQNSGTCDLGYGGHAAVFMGVGALLLGTTGYMAYLDIEEEETES